jgi:hypothetical protein
VLVSFLKNENYGRDQEAKKSGTGSGAPVPIRTTVITGLVKKGDAVHNILAGQNLP